MNLNKNGTGTMLDARIILTALWSAEIFSSLNGDTYRLTDPATIISAIENTSAVAATPALLTVMSIIFMVPIFMCVLTLILKHPMSLRINRIFGIMYTAIILAFFVLNFVLHSASYEYVWSTAQLVFMLLIVWFAWRRIEPMQESL